MYYQSTKKCPYEKKSGNLSYAPRKFNEYLLESGFSEVKGLLIGKKGLLGVGLAVVVVVSGEGVVAVVELWNLVDLVGLIK